jgi:HEAT repeat protein
MIADEIEKLIAELNGSDARVRFEAAYLLGRTGNKRAVKPLLNALHDSQYSVCHSAAIALGRIKDARSIQPLMEALQNHKPDVRKCAAIALEMMGDQRAVEPLITLLNDSEPSVRRSAIQALGQLRDSRAVEPLLAMMQNQNIDRNELKTIIHALGEIGDARAVEPILQKLDQYPNGADALAYIGDSSAVLPLIAALLSSDGYVRDAAAYALGILGDVRALPELKRLAREDTFVDWFFDNEINVAGAAGAAIEIIRMAQRPLEEIISIVNESHIAVDVWRAIVALGAVGDTKALLILERLASSYPDEKRSEAYWVRHAMNRIRRRCKNELNL